MPRYDVYRQAEGRALLLDVQADILDGLNTRAVVPLMPVSAAPKPAARLNPLFEFNGAKVLMVTQFIAAVPTALLREPVGNLASSHRAIIDALDMLFVGY